MLPALLYIAALVGWHLAGLTHLAAWWPYRLASLFDIWLYLPLPFLLLGAALRRRWRAAALLGLAALVFVLEYGYVFLPKAPTASGVPLRVMTANLLATNDGKGGLGAAVSEQRPDVLAVQELTPRLARSLADQLGPDYPFAALYPSARNPSLGVYSRHPLREAARSDADDCPCQQVMLDVGGRTVDILNVHPSRPKMTFRQIGPLPLPSSFDESGHQRALRAILDRVQAADGPLIVLGDFNLSDRDPAYRQLERSLVDAYRAAGWGFGYTFPSRNLSELPSGREVTRPPYFPLLRIDYVFYSQGLAAVEARVVDVPGSDHLSVVADLRLQADGAARRPEDLQTVGGAGR